ncbi:MAG: class I SAM-dependent methyltransferase [Chloroflexi bacterium]|nr:class I SAM-dependent methyltransferase [Chloroflexota bacterium]
MSESGGNWRRRLNAIWDDSWFYSEQLEKRLIEQALREARPYAHGILLDVGCGRKPYAALFRDRVRQHLGLDYPPTVDQHMSSGYAAPEVDVYAAGEGLPIRTGAVDTVLCTQVLEHTPNPARVMAEMACALRGGGCLILTAPQEWGLHQEPHDYYRYTRYGLEHLAREAGLRVEYIRPRGGIWAVLGQRWSAYLYDNYVRPFRRRGIRWAFLLSACFILPACALTQLLARGLDRLQFRPQNTLGYILVARKPAEDS